jgi:hypothetical protein
MAVVEQYHVTFLVHFAFSDEDTPLLPKLPLDLKFHCLQTQNIPRLQIDLLINQTLLLWLLPDIDVRNMFRQFL